MKAIQNSTQTLYFKKNTTSWKQNMASSLSSTGSRTEKGSDSWYNYTSGTFMQDPIAVNWYSYHHHGGQGWGWDKFNYDAPHLALYPNTGRIVCGNNETSGKGTLTVCFSTPIIATGVHNYNEHVDSYSGGMWNIRVEASNNNSDWTTLISGQSINEYKEKTILFENTNAYNYYKFSFNPGTSSYDDAATIKNFYYIGTQECYEPCAQEEATVSKIVPAYKLGYREGKYWGLG